MVLGPHSIHSGQLPRTEVSDNESTARLRFNIGPLQLREGRIRVEAHLRLELEQERITQGNTMRSIVAKQVELNMSGPNAAPEVSLTLS